MSVPTNAQAFKALETTPLFPPPHGVHSNFVNPYDRGPCTIPVLGVFAFLALVFCLNRVYIKIWVAKKASWDDCEFSMSDRDRTILTNLASDLLASICELLSVEVDKVFY